MDFFSLFLTLLFNIRYYRSCHIKCVLSAIHYFLVLGHSYYISWMMVFADSSPSPRYIIFWVILTFNIYIGELKELINNIFTSDRAVTLFRLLDWIAETAGLPINTMQHSTDLSIESMFLKTILVPCWN